MRGKNWRGGRVSGLAIGAIVILMIAAAAGLWWFLRPDPQPPGGVQPGPQANQNGKQGDEGKGGETARGDAVVSGEQYEAFFVGVAALDVEANQRAIQTFDELSQSLPTEPAVWANLAIGHLRLNNAPAARDALQQAVSLAPDNDHLAVLQAILAERSGDFEQAVRLLTSLQEPDAAALYRLSSLIERTGAEDATARQLEITNRILEHQPNNIVAQFRRARLAAKSQHAGELNDALQALAEHRGDWNEAAAQQYESALKAAKEERFAEAARFATFLENLNKPLPEYQQAIAALGVRGGSVGVPFRAFLKSQVPSATVAEADGTLSFEPAPDTQPATSADLFLTWPLFEEGPVSRIALSGNELRIGDAGPLPFPGEAGSQPRGRHVLEAADLNGDFQVDLVGVGSGGLAIYLQGEMRTFTPYSPDAEDAFLFDQPGSGVWALDFEADGDLDLLVAGSEGTTRLLRNGGDMTFTQLDELADVPAPREVRWADFDVDGDNEIVTIDGDGRLAVLWNERAGAFAEPAPVGGVDQVFVASGFGDLDHDGRFDLVALDSTGVVHAFSWEPSRAAWQDRELARWSDPPDLKTAFAQRRTSLRLADLDNNGGIDLVASTPEAARIWMQGSDLGYEPLPQTPAMFVTSLYDVDGDGLLDLAGFDSTGGVVARGQGTKNYHWQAIRPRANPQAGDQRINSFGLGGEVEIRAGRLLQLVPIDRTRLHFGLGTHASAGVARIVWPNGTVQAEFDLTAGQAVTAQQRLKGSCPFVFTRDENGLRFVKDFIWRSPLGLKINSQQTAGVTQTEDWIKIPGEYLAAIDGHYEVRITAELWETHFFDHISLMTVDHDEDINVFVDERFIGNRAPKLTVTAVKGPFPLASAKDESGRDVSKELDAIDGSYVDGFPLGEFQGVASEHWVEFELPGKLPAEGNLVLVGHGWVYPTDSSLNVAISQGAHPRPQSLALEVHEPDKGWRLVADNLGFPAGKNKTVLLPLPEEEIRSGARRFRLRTNLEVYWDSLRWARVLPKAELQSDRHATQVATLRDRGFSQLSPLDRRRPDIPAYDRIAGREQRWRDLEGFYTRFGDVRELLRTIDDRYVIMNAGDEIVLRFPAADSPPAGQTRDFVLIGDGWVKDGDYNTAHSRTVRPLPSHQNRDYAALGGPLVEDAIYQKHRGDWRQFHTRYISPRVFERGLWPMAPTLSRGKD